MSLKMTKVRDRKFLRWPLVTGVVVAAWALSFVAGIHPVFDARAEPLDRFEKWLNEEVVYIITEVEKVDFSVLRNDTDREAFIEKFWRDRDPMPTTRENEFYDAHYFRIKYANSRWGENGPGWQTDRGRIYITFGPPDEIEDHPDKELWRYYDGVFANVVLDFAEARSGG